MFADERERFKMQFIIFVIDNKSVSGSPTEMSAIDAFNERLEAEGNWVMAAGIEPPQNATTIDNRNGGASVTTSSLQESGEYFSGFWIIEAPDREAALKLAAEGSMACHRKVEVRPFLTR